MSRNSLGQYRIEHTKTKVASPQTNGICEHFHKTIDPAEILSGDVQQKDLPPWMNSKSILANGSCTTIMSARIKKKCVVDEHRWERSSMARKSGRKN
jgi:hypothetical protein